MGNGTSAKGVHDGLSEATKMIGVTPREWPHHVYGTGAGTTKVIFPNLDAARQEMERTLTISEAEWQPVLRLLHYSECLLVGNSTALSVAAALELARDAERESRFLVLAYDAAWRYLDLTDSEVLKVRTSPALLSTRDAAV
jgi:cysteine synthase